MLRTVVFVTLAACAAGGGASGPSGPSGGLVGASGASGPAGNATGPLDPLALKFCASKQVDPKKADLCRASQAVLMKEDEWKKALKTVEPFQQAYLATRELCVQNLTEAYSGASLAFEGFEKRDAMDMGRSFAPQIEALERAIMNTKEAREARLPMVEVRDEWVKAVGTGRDAHEQYAKLLTTFDYLQKRELAQAELKVKSLKNQTIKLQADLLTQIASAQNVTTFSQKFVSNPDVDDEAGAQALVKTRKATSLAAATKRAKLAVEAELVLAKKMLEKILARTAGTGMPTFPPYEPASNEAEKEISSIMKMNATIATDMEKATAKLASMMPTKL